MARFQRQVNDSFASDRFDDDTEMYQLFARFDPIRGAAFFKALQDRVDTLYRTKGATDGLTPSQVRAKPSTTSSANDAGPRALRKPRPDAAPTPTPTPPSMSLAMWCRSNCWSSATNKR
jgi:hypothetical protein